MLILGLGPPNPLVAPLSGTLEGAKFRAISAQTGSPKTLACHRKVIHIISPKKNAKKLRKTIQVLVFV